MIKLFKDISSGEEALPNLRRADMYKLALCIMVRDPEKYVSLVNN